MNKLLTFLLLLLALVNARFYYQHTFLVTKKLYNGTTGFNGLFDACDEMREKFNLNNVKPCTMVQLLDGFWQQTEKLQDSWVLDMFVNCVGYTTNSSDTDGTCLMPESSQLTTCTCEMLLPICCYY